MSSESAATHLFVLFAHKFTKSNKTCQSVLRETSVEEGLIIYP